LCVGVCEGVSACVCVCVCVCVQPEWGLDVIVERNGHCRYTELERKLLNLFVCEKSEEEIPLPWKHKGIEEATPHTPPLSAEWRGR